MAVNRTEQLNDEARGLDRQPSHHIAALLAKAQEEAAAVVAPSSRGIADAADLVADALEQGGRLAYAAAGSSGLMALADALELPGTFGIPRDRIVVLLAGGVESLTNLTGAPEDDAEQGAADVSSANLVQGDCLIAVSASGSTPYAVGALKAAKRLGLKTVAIANNPGSPILELADAGILLATPPEIIAGSTRMGAGTAQKIALNLLSTLAAVRLGHVHDGYMVNLHADNAKLRQRAVHIVVAIANCSEAEARTCLEQAGGSVKPAVLLAAGAADLAAALRLLDSTGQKLRPALSELEGNPGSRQQRA
ncbi:N-acetylmuramic acid 6-phosphate etherase [Phyllobacterium salinisoli]|uniref:N-acetylmuramic acid 6-phosphate etherase n=1 Tax=Phyllobacterium salinisoli TaxID=1899321 RepID=A0A368K447_9HYPH|nr:N-acetylmuramic acid 6-phosphate etherase [Phyllobacterium salinisoli]RCS24011.1 N-acetylmuramic acid 6-phosphate etherase [Phyllobacterium salinisoli]